MHNPKNWQKLHLTFQKMEGKKYILGERSLKNS